MLSHFPAGIGPGPRDDDHDRQPASVLASLYGFTLPEETVHQAEQQREQVTEAVDADPQVKEIVDQLERTYDLDEEGEPDENETPALSPQVEDFLREMERRFRRE